MTNSRCLVAVPLIAVSLAACATLGPTPATTGISPVPASRTGIEVQVGAVPGYYLSQATTEKQAGSPLAQIAAVLDVGGAMSLPGLFVAGRAVGPEHDTQAEPMIGYRTVLDDAGNFAIAGAVHGTHGSATDHGNTYEATRAGAEFAADVRLGGRSWFEPHLMGAISATAISARGDYCVDDAGEFGRDCPDPTDPMAPPEHRMITSVSGLYPAATGGIAVDMFRDGNGVFHGGRVALMAAAGVMPRVVSGEQESSRPFYSLGLTMSLGLGEGTDDD
jgi:hypothetical protein